MRPMRFKMTIALLLSFVFLAGCTGMALAMGKDVQAPMMTKEELKAMLGNPDLVILDVRLGADWSGSNNKIRGSVREDPEKVKTWAEKYSKDKTIVLYCS